RDRAPRALHRARASRPPCRRGARRRRPCPPGSAPARGRASPPARARRAGRPRAVACCSPERESSERDVVVAEVVRREVVGLASTATAAATTAVAAPTAAAAVAAAAAAVAATAAAVAAPVVTRRAAAAAAATEKEQLVRDDLGGRALVAVLVLPRTRLQPALDVDRLPLGQELLQGFRAVAPHDHRVPLGALLLLAPLRHVALGGREPHPQDRRSALRVLELGIHPEVADQHDLVEPLRSHRPRLVVRPGALDQRARAG